MRWLSVIFLSMALSSVAETIDGALLQVVNAPIARARLGISNDFILMIASNAVRIAAGANITVTTNVTSSNVIYTVAGSAGAAVGGSAAVQFAEGSAFDGTNGAATKFIYDRTNNQLRIVGTVPTIKLEDSILLTTNTISSLSTRVEGIGYQIITPFGALHVGSGGVSVTNRFGLTHGQSGSVIEISGTANAHNASVTNRITAATTVVLTNTADGQDLNFTLLGEVSGGTSRVITLIPHLGHLVADLDTFGTALATSTTFTLTNGNGANVDWKVRRLNGTNVALKKVSQFAF